MSFGFAVGDFIAVGNLCWSVYKKCKDSPGNYRELSSEVGALHNVIKEAEELLSQQTLTFEQETKLHRSKAGCEEVLTELDELLVKYENLGAKSQRTFDRIGFGMQDINGIRIGLISNVSILDALNNTFSYARLEGKLNLLIAEFRAGHRESSVISTTSLDSIVQNEQEAWETLRRELKDIGISPSIIKEQRQFIVSWFREAVAAGRLEEDAPKTYEYNSDLGDSYREGAPDQSDSGADAQEVVPPVSCVQEFGAVPVLSTLQTAGQSYQRPNRRPLQMQKGSRLQVSYLVSKLKSKEKRLLEAVKVGDTSTAITMLEKGAGTSARTEIHGWMALHLASDKGLVEIVQLLLEKGADINIKTLELGETALHMVSASDQVQCLRLLLDLGANAGVKDNRGATALHKAVTINSGRQPMMRLLLENGADINAKAMYLVLDKVEVPGTALHIAAVRGYKDAVHLLLKKGAEVNAKDHLGYTPLERAADYWDWRNEKLDGACERDGTVPKEFSSLAGKVNRHEAIVRMLVIAGADLEGTPMQAVRYQGQKEVFINHGAPPWWMSVAGTEIPG